MQISDNNMEIRSIQFHVLFPPDCFFFQEFFFMGGAIHPFPKIMRGEIAFFWGGWCNSPLPKNYERSGGVRRESTGIVLCLLARTYFLARA